MQSLFVYMHVGMHVRKYLHMHMLQVRLNGTIKSIILI